MDPELALTALQQVLDRDEVLLSVTDMDWERFAARFNTAAAGPFLSELPEFARRPEAEQRQPGGGTELAQRLAATPAPGRHQLLVDLVRGEAAAILGHGSPAGIDPHRGFMDTGFTSLTSVELRNRLNAVTGLALPPSVVYDYPNPTELAGHLLEGLAPPADGPVRALDAIRQLELALDPGQPADGATLAEITDGLRDLLRRAEERQPRPVDVPVDVPIDVPALDAASDDEMFVLIDKELGRAETA